MPTTTTKSGRRTHNTRLIKRDFSYSVDEIADLFGLHANAVRRWVNMGLIPIDDGRPMLFHGTDLKAFLDKRQSERKRPGKPNEFYCFRCRQQRPPLGNRVNLVWQTPTRLLLKAICSVCNAKLNKAGSKAKRAQYEDLFEILDAPESALSEVGSSHR